MRRGRRSAAARRATVLAVSAEHLEHEERDVLPVWLPGLSMSRRYAPPISDTEWQSFVDEEVTPRFPDGLTIVQGYGQWRNSKGVIAKENSRVLMVWHEPKPNSEESIEAIRNAYKARVKQESAFYASVAVMGRKYPRAAQMRPSPCGRTW